MANPNAKPPKGKTFTKGQSGNPKGRPKDLISKHLLKFAKSKEKIIVEIKDDEGELHKIAIATGEDVARTIMNKAASGEWWAVQIVLDRLEGKVKEKVELSGGIKIGKDLADEDYV